MQTLISGAADEPVSTERGGEAQRGRGRLASSAKRKTNTVGGQFKQQLVTASLLVSRRLVCKSVPPPRADAKAPTMDALDTWTDG